MNNFAIILNHTHTTSLGLNSKVFSSRLFGIYGFCILLFIAIQGCGSSKKSSNPEAVAPSGSSMSAELSIRIQYTFVEAGTQALLLNYPEAVSLYKEVLKLDPDNHAAAYEISRLLVQIGKPAEGLEYAKKAWQQDSKNYWYGKQASDLYLSLNKYSEAEKILLSMADQFPNEEEVRIELSDLYLKTGQNDKALKSLDQLEKMTGPSPQIGLQKFRIYAGGGKGNEAKTELRKLIKSDPYNTDYYRYLHDYFLASLQADSAAIVLEQLLEVDNSNTFALISLSQYYKRIGEDQKAAELQARALKSEGMSPEGRLQLLLALAVQLEKDSSLIQSISQASDQLLKEIPDNALLMALRADLFRFRGQMDSARYWLNASLLKDGTQENLWENLLYLDAGMERYDLLYKDSEKALEYFPNSETLLYLQGVSAFTLKKYEDARYALEKTLKVMKPDQERKGQILGTLGDIYHYLGEHALSDIAFDEALQIDPDNATLLNNYAYYLSLKNVNLPKAEKMVLKAIELEPNTASFEDTYGWILYQQAKYAEAKKWIQAAYDKSPSPDVADHLGDVFFQTGDAVKALQYWKKAKELGLTGSEIDRKINTGKL